MPAPLPVTANQLVEAVNDQLVKLIPSRSGPLGLSAVLSKGVLFTNAGISVDDQMQRVAPRVEIGGRSMNADVPWTNFLSGFIADRLQGLDWSLFVDAGHITETVKALVNQGLASGERSTISRRSSAAITPMLVGRPCSPSTCSASICPLWISWARSCPRSGPRSASSRRA